MKILLIAALFGFVAPVTANQDKVDLLEIKSGAALKADNFGLQAKADDKKDILRLSQAGGEDKKDILRLSQLNSIKFNQATK